MSLRKIRAIAMKEYLHLIRDFRSLYLAFCIPLLLILLFGYALSLDVEQVQTVVVDQDRSPGSRDLIRQVEASRYFHVIGFPANAREAVAHIDQNRAVMAILIPPGWDAILNAQKKSPLQVIIDGSDPNFAGNTRAYINAFIARENHHSLVRYLNIQGRRPIQMPVNARIRVWFNEDLESSQFIVPGIIAVIVMIVGALLTSLVIAREYENGTMETLRSLPLGAFEFLTGKAIPYFFIALIDVLVAILMGQLLFGVVIKSSFWLMMAASCLYVAVALTIGLLISIKTKSQLVANQMAILVTYLPSLLMSDFVFPRLNMPAALQALSWLVPATYYIDILNGLYLRKVSIGHLWLDYSMLVLMFVLLGVANLAALKKEGF
jgi:ABC-2 type transport system permease protein